MHKQADLIELLRKLLKKKRAERVERQDFPNVYGDVPGRNYTEPLNVPLFGMPMIVSAAAKQAFVLPTVLTTGGAAIGGAIGGPEGAVIGGAAGGGAGLGANAAWLVAAANPATRNRILTAMSNQATHAGRTARAKQITTQLQKPVTQPQAVAEVSKTNVIPKETRDLQQRGIVPQVYDYAKVPASGYGAMMTDPGAWLGFGGGMAAGGLIGGVGAAGAMGAMKSGSIQDLGDTWNDLSIGNKGIAGTGAALSLGSLLAAGAGYGTPTEQVGGGLTGLALGSYGLSGGKFDNIIPTFKKLISGHQPAASSPTQNPALAKYFNQDGSVNFLEAVRAKNDDLKQALTKLTPQQRADMRSKLQAFKPNFMQSMGARAAGINIEDQQKRFGQLLA